MFRVTRHASQRFADILFSPLDCRRFMMYTPLRATFVTIANDTSSAQRLTAIMLPFSITLYIVAAFHFIFFLISRMLLIAILLFL